jgi:hypothetical protein
MRKIKKIMPNHCVNRLFVIAPADGRLHHLKEFEEFAKDENGVLSANKFIPYPEEFRKKDDEEYEFSQKISKMPEEVRRIYTAVHPYPENGFNSGGYEWCVANWGTKWNFYDISLEKPRPNILYYQARTAWTPAIPIVDRMAYMFPMLDFTCQFFERGGCFCGVYKKKHDESLIYREWKYETRGSNEWAEEKWDEYHAERNRGLLGG